MEEALATTVGIPTERKAEALLPLDLAERAVTWSANGRVRTHVFRRLTAADWEDYIAHIRFEVETGAPPRIDVTVAGLRLYERAVLLAEGYPVRGDAKLESLPRWKDLLPIGERLQAVRLLMQVDRHEGDDGVMIEPDIQIAALDAIWGITGPGRTQTYRGLIHRFTPPTGEHLARYSREISRAKIIGGSRTGLTVYQPREKILVKLYDELIQSVEGYSVRGEPLTDREATVREMDPFHKAAAASIIFDLLGRRDEEEPEDRP